MARAIPRNEKALSEKRNSPPLVGWVRGEGDNLLRTPYFSYSIDGLYCLQQGKHRNGAVDHAQQVETRDSDDSEKKNFLLCRACRYPITRKDDRIAINEKHEHVFANPHGYIFQIGCFSHAQGCVIAGEETSYFTWFPGYTWRFALCGQCGMLLGWAFRSSESQFFGLILEKLEESD